MAHRDGLVLLRDLVAKVHDACDLMVVKRSRFDEVDPTRFLDDPRARNHLEP